MGVFPHFFHKFSEVKQLVALAFSKKYATMNLQILMEVLPWPTRLLLLVSAAVLALMLAPLALSARAMISMSSMPALAWIAVLAAILAPTAPSSLKTNQRDT